MRSNLGGSKRKIWNLVAPLGGVLICKGVGSSLNTTGPHIGHGILCLGQKKGPRREESPWAKLGRVAFVTMGTGYRTFFFCPGFLA